MGATAEAGRQDALISVVVPVYNEMGVLPRLIPQLRGLVEAGCEVLCVDGGSSDGTAEALEQEFRVARSAKGRARQMNEGASRATGEILFFLHADSILPADPVRQIRSVMAREDAGCFGIRFSSASPVLKFCSWMSNARVRLRGIAYGDQGIFVRRDVFWAAGGFPDLPIMEDLQLSLNLRASGVGFGMCRDRITTSCRRFGKGLGSVIRNWMAMVRLRKMYRDGEDIHVIADLYRDVR